MNGSRLCLIGYPEHVIASPDSASYDATELLHVPQGGAMKASTKHYGAFGIEAFLEPRAILE